MKQIAPAFCTVVTNRYIPYARVLARRLAACHKGATLFALLADEDEGRFADEPFELVRLADLADAGAVDFVGLRDMAFYYGPFELCNAVRPSVAPIHARLLRTRPLVLPGLRYLGDRFARPAV